MYRCLICIHLYKYKKLNCQGAAFDGAAASIGPWDHQWLELNDDGSKVEGGPGSTQITKDEDEHDIFDPELDGEACV